MKTVVFAAAMMTASTLAYAGPDMSECMNFGSVYESAASIRDTGASPEQALEMTAGYSTVPLAVRKQIINNVYFDNRFAYAGGPALRNQMIDLCVNGPKNWKPLK